MNTATNKARVLVVDDDKSITEALALVLPDEGFDPVFAHNGREGLEQAKEGSFEAVVTDLRMPGLNGMELLQSIHQLKPKLPVILITAHGTTDTAIRAMQNGAFEYLLKPYDIPELLDVMKRAVESYRLASKPVRMGEAGSASGHNDAIIGASKAMQGVYKDIGRFASKPVTVLIQGETGTGKELVARALYQYSERAEKPFIAVNCAAIPENLLESELFGHEKGAFTGAETRRIGRFEQANGGTLFLDEIGDLNPSVQVKLLRALQDKTIQRIGSKETISIDVRILAATHIDLETAIAEGRFREDLYYRLSGIVIDLPPLDDRREDIEPIARYIVERYTRDYALKPTSIRPDALQFLQQQNWPGNVRQLENTLRKALLECEGYAISIASLEAALAKKKRKRPAALSKETPDCPFEKIARLALQATQDGDASDALTWVNERVEKALYALAIEKSGGNQAKAARWLGTSRITMREKLRKHHLRPGSELED